MKVLAIAGVGLRMAVKDRTSVFFMAVMPFLMVFMMGLMFGGGQRLSVGVAGGDGPLPKRLAAALAEGGRVEVVRLDGEAALREAVERGEVGGGLLIPAGYAAAVGGGATAEVRYLSRPSDPQGMELAALVRSAVLREAGSVGAAAFGAAHGDGSFAANLDAADAARAPGITVRATTVGETVFPEGMAGFALSAPPLLLLYTFLTSLTAAAGLVATRVSGLSARMYSTPTPVWALLAGEAAGRIAVALAQGLIIMLGSALLFGVAWGDPLGAAALLVAFSLVGGGAAMLLGSVFRTQGAVTSAGLILGLGLAAAGGSMAPLEALGDTARRLAYLTPHAWGYEGFAALVRHGAGFADVLPQVTILCGYAAVFFVAGTLLLRRALIRN
ncbi:ABC transporter permease [Spongiactinospora sp. TRM90649]|uniref:ABC transporter permease n=1 Tax=Spongiactinospora sp. TRM90649 TaxID=3031114 RepID=UPI0023F7D8DB|nr:ABC transporter permease [Spongiactinospora sp. TRM90649]MDF5757984.1 ABC transporter permease [Spongiactinospora sp. TRM90649]